MKPAKIVHQGRMKSAVQTSLTARETTVTVEGLGAFNTTPLNRIDARVILEAAAGNIILREKVEAFAPPPTATALGSLMRKDR